jgi:hypothetical protein
VRPSPVDLQYRPQLSCQAGKVAVIHATVVELGGKFAEQPGPLAPGWRGRDRDLDAAFDDLHRGETGGCGTGLLPGAVPAGRRTPLGDRDLATRSDRPAAPATGRGGRPAFRAVDSGRLRFGAGRLGRCSLGPLTPVPLALPPSCTVFGASAISHAEDGADESPVTRHHELCNPTVHKVCGTLCFLQ